MRGMNRRGFSLLELMIVLAIVGIMAALAAFAMSSFQIQGRVAEEMRRTMSRIQQMRQLAATTGQCYGVFIGANPSTTMIPNPINPGVNPPVPASARVITFRRAQGTACDATVTDLNFFGSDTILSVEYWGASGDPGDAKRNRQVGATWTGLMWENAQLGQLNANADFIALFNDPNTGLANLQGGPLAARATIAQTGVPPRVRLELRSLESDVPPFSMTRVNNQTVRELDIGPTGSAIINDCAGNGGPNGCP